MVIFIERKRFCHFHCLEIPWSSVVSCGPACTVPLSPVVPRLPCCVRCSSDAIGRVWSLVCSFVRSFVSFFVCSFVSWCVGLLFLWNLLARCLLVVLLVDSFVGWFSASKKICSTSPPRGNQVDGLPRASSCCVAVLFCLLVAILLCCFVTLLLCFCVTTLLD